MIPFDGTIVDREAHINKYAMMALGHAIEVDGIKNEGEEDEEEGSDNEEEMCVKNLAFKFLYNKAMKQSKFELVIRVD